MNWRDAAICMLLAAAGCAPAPAASVADQEFARALRATPNAAHGQQLFAQCVACHATDGGGSVDGNVPTIADQHFRVLVRQLIDYRYARRWDPRMERIADQHTLPDAQAIADVARFVSSLPRTRALGTGDGRQTDYGRQVFTRLCADCHGQRGQGNDDPAVPRLAGQHYAYLLRQMYDAVDRRRPTFSAEHVRLLKRFVRDDFVGVADYLSRLEAPDRSTP